MEVIYALAAPRNGRACLLRPQERSREGAVNFDLMSGRKLNNILVPTHNKVV